MSALAQSSLPTLYEHYTSGGIQSGLNADNPQFKLNDREITLYSGAVHYFRVPKPYWRDRLKKLRAAGLNAVETYVPWNLHEFENGTYDFGNGGSDMQDFLDVKEYLKIAQEEDLFAIVRPGPFICAEWEFGGLPSWLLREKDIKVRTSDRVFMSYVERYFNMLLPILAALQFTKGGPIIAMQIENEYGSVQENGKVDKVYLEMLKNFYHNNGIVELPFTADGVAVFRNIGALPGILQTANFQGNPEKEFRTLQELQPGRPIMAMEYWTGWFDHWSEKHHVRKIDNYVDVLKRIITYPASVNFYMFHGGTSFGFMNGANLMTAGTDNSGFQPDTTSYDYDGPLTENGDYTEKYIKTKELIAEYNPVKTKLPQAPAEIPRGTYPTVQITEQLTLHELERQAQKIPNSPQVSMENLPINHNSGQSYGYIVYKKENFDIPPNSVLKITGHVCDTVMVVLNGVLISKPLKHKADLFKFGYWRVNNSHINLGPNSFEAATLELVVENWGRVNFGKLKQFVQFKGLWQGPVLINDVSIKEWDIYPLEFKTKWTNSLTGWQKLSNLLIPSLYRTKFYVDEPVDTYVDMRKWTKGIVIINGFVLGRYSIIGPQLALYLPAPLVKKGENEIIVFEHFSPAKEVLFSNQALYSGITNFMPMLFT